MGYVNFIQYVSQERNNYSAFDRKPLFRHIYKF
jgi:hypothetical protein